MRELLDISGFLGLPPQGSAHAPLMDYWTGVVHWLMLILAVGWGTFFIVTLVKFRAGNNPRANYKGTKAKWAKYQEGTVVLAEALLLFVFAIPNWSIWRDVRPTGDNVVEVHVVAEQFAWNFHYPGADGVFGERDPERVDTQLNPLGINWDDPNAADDIVTLNEIHLPVDRPVITHLSSKDVIHSFNMNNFRVKQDAIPGLVIPVWFTPTQTGRSEIACAQLCGLSHYRMRAFVVIHEQTDYDQWLKDMDEEMELYRG